MMNMNGRGRRNVVCGDLASPSISPSISSQNIRMHTLPKAALLTKNLGNFGCKFISTATKYPIYVFLFWELRGISPNLHIHVSVSDLYIPRICPHIFLQQNRQTDPGNIFNSHRYMSVGAGKQNFIILFWKQQFHFREYINGNQAFIFDSHRPFICSVWGTAFHLSLNKHFAHFHL